MLQTSLVLGPGGYAKNSSFNFSVFYITGNYECRVPRANEVFQQMITLARGLTENKNGNNTFDCTIPAWVEPEGVEPSSKHIRRKLSTCLFTHCVFETWQGA